MKVSVFFSMLLVSVFIVCVPLIGAAATVKCEIPSQLPSKLSQTCFQILASSSGDPSYSNFFEYRPQYPSYSDGAIKRRWIYLPEQGKIETEDLDNWVFPKGTVLFKEFSIGPAKIETRVLEKISGEQGPSAWRFSNYAWTKNQADADLVTNSFYKQSDAELGRYSAADTQKQFKVETPKRCMDCHSGARDVVNGFNYLQLSSENLNPNIKQIGAAGFLSSPPVAFDVIPGSDLDRKAIGYIQSNCAICHTLGGMGPGSFKHSYLFKTLDNESLLSDKSLIEKGNPDESYLMQMFSSGEMPYVSPVQQDVEGVSLIRAWISSLK